MSECVLLMMPIWFGLGSGTLMPPGLTSWHYSRDIKLG